MGIKNSAVRVIASAIALAFIFIRPLLFCTGYAAEEENMRDWWSVWSLESGECSFRTAVTE